LLTAASGRRGLPQDPPYSSCGIDRAAPDPASLHLPGCLDGVDIPRDQLNTVIHEVLHMVMEIPVTDEAKVVAISGVIQPRTHRRK
jgi:hypothetical protein